MNEFEVCKAIDVFLELQLNYFWSSYLCFFVNIFNSIKNFLPILTLILFARVVKHFNKLIFALIFRAGSKSFQNFVMILFFSLELLKMIFLNFK